MNLYQITTDAPVENHFKIEGDSEMDAMINWVAYCLDECADGRSREFGEIVSVKEIEP